MAQGSSAESTKHSSSFVCAPKKAVVITATCISRLRDVTSEPLSTVHRRHRAHLRPHACQVWKLEHSLLRTVRVSFHPTSSRQLKVTRKRAPLEHLRPPAQSPDRVGTTILVSDSSHQALDFTRRTKVEPKKEDKSFETFGDITDSKKKKVTKLFVSENTNIKKNWLNNCGTQNVSVLTLPR